MSTNSAANLDSFPPPEATPSSRRPRTRVLMIILILSLGAVVYHPVWRFEFLNFDDADYVSGNPYVKEGLTVQTLEWALTANLTHFSKRAEYWSPITLFTRLVDGELYGIKAGPHHVTSALLHTINALLLLLALRSLTGAWWRSAFVAMLFLVHPLNVEPVCWLSARKDVVSGTFFFLTLLAYGSYARNPTRSRYLILLLAFIGGAMAKPMVVSVPFVLLLLDFWPLKRLPVSDQKAMLGILAEKLPLFIIAGVVAFLAVLDQQDWGALQSVTKFPLNVRVENAFLSYATFLRRVFWPSDLAIYYPHPGNSILWWQAGVAFGLLVAITAASVWMWRRSYLLVGWFWFGIVLGPVIGLVQIGPQAMADRYAYPAVVGIFIALVWVFWDLAKSKPRLGQAIAVLAVAAFAAASMRQVQFWQDSEAAFAHAVQVTKDNDVAYLNLGSAYYVKRDLVHARESFLRSLKLQPVQAFGWNNLAAVEADLGHDDAAIKAYRLGLRIYPESPKSLLFLGRLLLKHGNIPEAEADFLHASTLEPGWAEPYGDLGRLYVSQERWNEAAKMLTDFLQLRPEDNAARALLARAEERLHRR